MDCSRYETLLRPFGCFQSLEIGFTAFLSNLVGAVRARKALRVANMDRLTMAHEVLDAIFMRAELLPLLERCAMLAGLEMAAAVAGMSAAAAAVDAVREPHMVRPVVHSRPMLPVCRPTVASESAYLALTLCVFPMHRGHLESYEMDQAVRLVKAEFLVEEYVMFTCYLEMGFGEDWRTTGISPLALKFHRTLQESIIGRLRHLSIAFLPVGSRNESFHVITERVKRLCRTDCLCFQDAQDDHFEKCYDDY